MTDINKLPIPKLKKLARELGVDPKQSIPRLRKAVAAAQAEEEPAKAPPKAKGRPKRTTPKKAGSTKASSNGTPSRSKSTPKGAANGTSEKLDAVLQALNAVGTKLSAFDERLSALESSDTASESEVVESTDDVFEDEDEDEDEDGANGHDQDGIPAEVRPYLVEDEEGGFELDISSEDVDEMDAPTLKAVLGVLGVEIGRTRSVRKLQAKLRELIADADEADEPEPSKTRRSKPKSKSRLTDVPEPGTLVVFEDDDGVFPAYVVDDETFGEECSSDNLEEGDCFIAFDADPNAFMEARLDQLSLR